jgi:hypothetical protein
MEENKEVSETVDNVEDMCAEMQDVIVDDYGYIIEETENMSIFGCYHQRQEMFEDWAKYIGEVQNPNNTKQNLFLKNSYAPLDEVLNVTRPLLSKYGFGIMQFPKSDGTQVSVQTILTHKSGAMISFPKFTLTVAKADAQSIIAGVTYARRGSLNPILATHGENDDDGNIAAGNDKKAKKTSEDTDKPHDDLNDLFQKIATVVSSLQTKGFTNETIGTTIGTINKIDGKPVANYHKITNKTVAEQVLAELKKLEGSK